MIGRIPQADLLEQPTHFSFAVLDPNPMPDPTDPLVSARQPAPDRSPRH